MIQGRVKCRFCALCLGLFAAVMILLVLSVQLAVAGKTAPTTGSLPTLMDKSEKGNVQLPGGMNPMDVIKQVQRNRERLSNRDSLDVSKGGPV